MRFLQLHPPSCTFSPQGAFSPPPDRARLTLRGKPGQSVKVRIGERLATVKRDPAGRARLAALS
ncbi:hypothetical protein [Massilia putida]|uniref:hypothetical protein n=1 Tax=Massilia putida TaxID=1141883 RepID=UPI0012EC79F3|nr:hypothetical protein [Massilia putida]